MSDCDVCIGDFDCDAEFYSAEMRKARKTHKCCECGRIIERRETYEHVIGKWDGDVLVYDTCRHCHEVRTVFTCGEGWMFGSLWDDMLNCVFPVLTTATTCFVKLSPDAKQFVVERWRKSKGLAE